MDVVLEAFDRYALDRAWAWLLPLRVPVEDGLFPAAAVSGPLRTGLNATALAFAARAAPTASALAHAASNAATATGDGWQTVSVWPRDDPRRQIASLLFLVQLGIFVLYFGISGASYRWLFDHRMMQHPRFIKGQVRMEIMTSVKGFPWLNIMTLPWFFGEVRGWSMTYDAVDKGPFGGGWAGYAYMSFSAAFFLWFTDVSIYWVHRWLHWPSVYKHLHKSHHKWVIPTPFASHAFHPIDGYLQSLPYHVFVYVVPVHRLLFVGLFVFVNLWSIFIHDSDMIVDHPLERIINGPAHHTLHHMYFTCNYGQYFTWSDRLGGSYRHPLKEDDPLLAVLNIQTARQRLKDELAAATAADKPKDQ